MGSSRGTVGAGRDWAQAGRRAPAFPLRPAPLESEALREEIELPLRGAVTPAASPSRGWGRRLKASSGGGGPQTRQPPSPGARSAHPTVYNVRVAIAWQLLGAAETLSRAAHKLCLEVPDLDDLKAEAFELGRRVSR